MQGQMPTGLRSIGAEHEFDVVVVQLFRPVVAHNGINGAVQHPLTKCFPVLTCSEWGAHTECSIEPCHVVVGVHEMGCGCGTGDLKSVQLRLPNHVDTVAQVMGDKCNRPPAYFRTSKSG